LEREFEKAADWEESIEETKVRTGLQGHRTRRSKLLWCPVKI